MNWYVYAPGDDIPKLPPVKTRYR